MVGAHDDRLHAASEAHDPSGHGAAGGVAGPELAQAVVAPASGPAADHRARVIVARGDRLHAASEAHDPSGHGAVGRVAGPEQAAVVAPALSAAIDHRARVIEARGDSLYTAFETHDVDRHEAVCRVAGPEPAVGVAPPALGAAADHRARVGLANGESAARDRAHVRRGIAGAVRAVGARRARLAAGAGRAGAAAAVDVGLGAVLDPIGAGGDADAAAVTHRAAALVAHGAGGGGDVSRDAVAAHVHRALVAVLGRQVDVVIDDDDVADAVAHSSFAVAGSLRGQRRAYGGEDDSAGACRARASLAVGVEAGAVEGGLTLRLRADAVGADAGLAVGAGQARFARLAGDAWTAAVDVCLRAVLDGVRTGCRRARLAGSRHARLRAALRGGEARRAVRAARGLVVPVDVDVGLAIPVHRQLHHHRLHVVHRREHGVAVPRGRARRQHRGARPLIGIAEKAHCAHGQAVHVEHRALAGHHIDRLRHCVAAGGRHRDAAHATVGGDLADGDLRHPRVPIAFGGVRTTRLENRRSCGERERAETRKPSHEHDSSPFRARPETPRTHGLRVRSRRKRGRGVKRYLASLQQTTESGYRHEPKPASVALEQLGHSHAVPRGVRLLFEKRERSLGLTNRVREKDFGAVVVRAMGRADHRCSCDSLGVLEQPWWSRVRCQRRHDCYRRHIEVTHGRRPAHHPLRRPLVVLMASFRLRAGLHTPRWGAVATSVIEVPASTLTADAPDGERAA
ncbi:hypothetical protein A7982_13870 [Minicystis rosea]|nr:hypothetical protein A7982_13870 [Minicystis rosea]